MLVRYFTEVALAPHDAELALLRSPQEWIPGLARQADLSGQGLLAEVGFGRPGLRIEKRVVVHLAGPRRLGTTTRVPLSWHAAGPEGLFPVLEGDLELAALGALRTQLSLSASYRPPLGPLGRAVDRALLHRVAEATIRDFVERVARALESAAVSASASAISRSSAIG